MTQPDATTWLIFIVQAIGFIGLWLKNRIQSYQHRLMWKEYAKEHKMNGNGGIT